MAWLITLALFLWIGGAFVKLCDYRTAVKASQAIAKKEGECQRRAEQALIETPKERRFLADVYAAAWMYYQKLEPQFYAAWADKYSKTYEIPPMPDSPGMARESAAIFGEAIRYVSLRKALEEMLKHPELRVYRCDEGNQLVAIQTALDADTSQIASQIDNKIPSLGDFYHWSLIQMRTGCSEFISSCIPQHDDTRVFQYNCPYWNQVTRSYDWIISTRAHTPKDYPSQIEEIHREYQL